jgi:hypothetical protein
MHGQLMGQFFQIHLLQGLDPAFVLCQFLFRLPAQIAPFLLTHWYSPFQ